MQVNYMDGTASGTTINHGTTSGSVTSSVLPAIASTGVAAGPGMPTQEHIVSVTGYSGTYVNQVTLTTNLGRSVSAGSFNGGTAFSQSSSGQVLGWFSGRSGSWMDNMAFNWVGPLAYIVYYSDGGTFEISTVDPIHHPVSSFTAYWCKISGQSLSYMCGVLVTLSSGQSAAAGVTGAASFTGGTVSTSTVNIPASAASHNIQMGVYVATFSNGVGSQVCGLTVGFAGTGVASVTVGSTSGSCINVANLNYAGFSNGVYFRGFKGHYTPGTYPAFTTTALYSITGLIMQD